jgi:hypothetical protein
VGLVVFLFSKGEKTKRKERYLNGWFEVLKIVVDVTKVCFGDAGTQG